MTPERTKFDSSKSTSSRMVVIGSSGIERPIKTPSKITQMFSENEIKASGMTFGRPLMPPSLSGAGILPPFIQPQLQDQNEFKINKELSEDDRMYMIRKRVTELVEDTDWEMFDLPEDINIFETGRPTNEAIITLGRMMFNKLYYNIKYDNAAEELLTQIINNSDKLSMVYN